ncbi:MAG: alpha/beta fold hydrolase [Comamonadaceae bacterium]|nr:MAG: alpha/beta fold hydrolase [Comamonadaceae bacterium]
MTKGAHPVITTVNVNGCDFRCDVRGDGPPLVFIHGEIHGMDYWEHQMAEFSRDFRCLSYDRRGHAGTPTTAFGYSVANQARDLEELMDHFAMQEAVIVALAFGTTIAANFAIDHRERVRALVIAAWSEMHDARSYLQRWERSGLRAAEAVDAGGREALVELLRAEGGDAMFKVIPPRGSPLREAAIQLLASHPADEYRRGMLEMASSVPVLVPRFRELDLPVLGLCGTEDPFPDQPAQLAGMRGFEEAPSIPEAGRFVHWEQPAAFNRQVRRFLEARL